MDDPMPHAQFSQALAGLKRRGSNLLVVGPGQSGGHVQACGRLLGTAEAARERLLVFTAGAERLDERLGDVDPTSVHVVDAVNLTRSTATESGTPVPPRTIDVAADDLDALRDAVTSEIEAYGALEPAELRVCIDSLRPLLADHAPADVTGFLDDVTTEVSDARGMGHYHLPVATDDPAVEEIASLFDAVVELRNDTDGHRQRWHLEDLDLTTDWLPL